MGGYPFVLLPDLLSGKFFFEADLTGRIPDSLVAEGFLKLPREMRVFLERKVRAKEIRIPQGKVPIPFWQYDLMRTSISLHARLFFLSHQSVPLPSEWNLLYRD